MPRFPSLSAAALALSLAAGLVAGPLAAPVAAQGFRADQVVQARILPGWQESDGTRIVALHLDLAPGWHTYFRIPGDAGIAPQFDWRQSQNLSGVQTIWPRPRLYEQGGYQSLIYDGQVVLPLRLTPQDPSRPVALMGALTIGVCDDICVPVDLNVAEPLRGAGAPDASISAAMATAARAAQGAGLDRVTCTLEPRERGGTLTLRATLPDQGEAEFIALEAPGGEAYVATARTWREGGDLVAEAHVRVPRGQPLGIDRQSLSYFILSDRAMLWGQGCTGG